MTSSRRTNEPSGLEVESSTAGASGGRDLGPIRSALDELHDVIANIAFEAAQLERWLNSVYAAIDEVEMDDLEG